MPRILKKYVEQIDEGITLKLGEKKLSKWDKTELRDLLKKTSWGWTDRHYYSLLKKKMLRRGPKLNLWKRTRGDVDKVLDIIDVKAPKHLRKVEDFIESLMD